ncbi:hypothetical protein [Raoultella terrigena]|uniref:hypothetical protein n=1 Tax=Raoultella terrigena TaxID=577 RepID=UPI0030E5C5DC
MSGQYLRPPIKSGSREDVLARCFEAIASDDYKKPSMEERIQQRFDKDVWYDNLEASMKPGFVPVGPMRPTDVDDRFKNYRSRYGMVSND